MIKAVILDMDGVLIDTEKYYIQLGMDITKEMGYEILTLNISMQNAEDGSVKF